MLMYIVLCMFMRLLPFVSTNKELSHNTNYENNYCINGEIINLTDIKGIYCKCFSGYTGIRCHHLILSDYQHSKKDEMIVSPNVAIILISVIITVGCILSVYKFTKRNKLQLPLPIV
ncbi:secreted EGF-like protein [NY_014 poxvirus]|uniref:secreted EGF-like protein n=1 Tax=NY_014 poxvirus TaxID=2025360 RepID=UPI000B9A0095|nr:secreted EGF-like protein [NY_014 poxvirus]AST09418.1 secreted EGF-like protein [NY_014 poxvirus]